MSEYKVINNLAVLKNHTRAVSIPTVIYDIKEENPEVFAVSLCVYLIESGSYVVKELLLKMSNESLNNGAPFLLTDGEYTLTRFLFEERQQQDGVKPEIDQKIDLSQYEKREVKGRTFHIIPHEE